MTLSFANTDFSEVAFRNSFGFIVQEGDRYAVEVTIDDQYADLVDVLQEGIRLRIGFDEDFGGDIRATTLEGIVTVPSLARIDLDNSAHATVAGFSQSYVEINLSGSSVLEAANNRFDFVHAVQSGSSRLEFEDVAAVPAAHIELTGSSSAVVNVMTGGTLTGSVASSSNLSYCGSSISLNIVTSDTASVTRLGDTR